MARTKGISGLAVAMIGAGALLLRAAIRGTSPVQELRDLVTRNKLEPLSTSPRGQPLADPAYTPTPAGGGFPTGGGSGKARVVGARPHVAAEAHFIANTWPVTADATLVSTGHIPNSDHYTGHAIDVMLPKENRQALGNAIFQHYVSNADSKHVKYVIWQHAIWSQNRGTHSYSKNDHMGHVHISFYPVIQGRVGR